MRSCNERNILHCLESYLYYVILEIKKYFLRREKNRQYIYTLSKI